MTVRINKQKINLREKLTEFEDKVNFDEVVRGLGEYTGNVGIGTTNPAFKLEIQGDEPIIMLKDSSGDNLAYLGDGSSVGDHSQLALYDATDGTNTPTVLLNAGGSAYFNAGNVGIGTTNPGVKLSINLPADLGIPDLGIVGGSIIDTISGARGLVAGHASGGDYFLQVQRIDNTPTAYDLLLQPNGGNVGIGNTNPQANLQIGDSTAGSQWIRLSTQHGDFSIGNASAGTPAEKYFSIYDQDVNEHRIYIKDNGNVGIGTTSPTNTLDIYRNTTSTSDNVFTLRSDVGGSIAQIKFKVTADGSAYTGSTPLTSDNRLKHNERQISEAIQTLGKITPRKYIKTSNLYEANHDFEIDEDGNPVDENGEVVEHRIEAGIIAQEVMDVPELAFAVRDEELDEDGNTVWPYSLDYNSLFTYAIAAIQEQQSIIEDLKSRIETLESK